jgi:2-oxo-4-hydroxy-4-carboxy--5-ureidoimidazoline (OHCU) decarboxylase
MSAEFITAIGTAYNKFPHIVEIEFLSKDIDKARVTNIKQSLVRFVESKQSSVMAELIRWTALVES